MTKYTILLSKKAQKQLDKLSDNIAEPILSAIALLRWICNPAEPEARSNFLTKILFSNILPN
jgi:mRNA-degrading endonuclease RelE of RelBE toxin-antitoxin system